MSVTVRPYRRGGWEVDILWRSPDGQRRRERKRTSVTAKSAAQRWGEARERELLIRGPAQPPKEVPTLETFAPRFIEGYAKANRQKPSGIAGKETILRVHLVPLFGGRKLDAITNEAIQSLKSTLRDRAPKTVNNVLTVLNMLLKTAVNWEVIHQLPCTIRLLPTPQTSAGFHDFDAFERLVAAAKALDARTYLVVLLGGEAGLRCGEMMALEWADVDFVKGQLCVQRSDWKGHVTSTKGGRLRYVPLTQRLGVALRAHRHLRGARVVSEQDGRPLSQKVMQCLVRRAAKRANVVHEGIHVLRHTFCSHLAMRGAPARAIQELAGHKDLTTTQRYMHLTPAATRDAIRLLDGHHDGDRRGDIVETGTGLN
ncbi:MAG TPA: tyrosine-type recombinase/integrase [Vicinamibacterales bacterium]|nr:tyrosine-type recombinase/integrase [Vicinamibacterales bacterium]